MQQPHRPGKRKLTAKQKKALRRKRKINRILNGVMVLCVLAVAFFAGVLVFTPRNDSAVHTMANGPLVTPPAAVFTAAPTPTSAPEITAVPMPTAAPEPTAEPTAVPTATPEAELRSVRFRVTGDIMATEDQLGYAKKAGGSNGYDFNPQFALISASLQDADYTMGNLETTIGRYKNKHYSGYPMFNTPEVYLDTLKNAGYDFFTLANNHMLDRWFDGMKNTVGHVERMGFDFCGAYRTPEERQTPKVIEIGGIRFGFLSYTQTTNRMEAQCDRDAKEYGVPYLLESDFAADISRLRSAGAEVVIVFAHWGAEYNRQPDKTELEYARKLAEAGADIILGSHPHVVQKAENLLVLNDDGTTRSTFVLYSLGNFISTQDQKPYTDSGIILELTVQEQPHGVFSVKNASYIPTYCWKHGETMQVVSSAQYLDNRPEGMSDSAYKRMKTTYNETVQLFGDTLPVLTK